MLSNKYILENLRILMLIEMCVCVDQECEEKPCFCLPGRVGPVCLKTNPADVIFAKCKLRDSLDFKASVALIFIALNLDKSITFPSLLSFYLKFFFLAEDKSIM